MANFIRRSSLASQAGEVCYTTPSNKTGLIIGLLAANISDKVVTVDVSINSDYIIKNAPVPVGSTLAILDGKLAVEANEVLTVTSSEDNSIQLTATILEL
jgi:hypothetical protein